MKTLFLELYKNDFYENSPTAKFTLVFYKILTILVWVYTFIAIGVVYFYEVFPETNTLLILLLILPFFVLIFLAYLYTNNEFLVFKTLDFLIREDKKKRLLIRLKEWYSHKNKSEVSSRFELFLEKNNLNGKNVA